MKITSMDAVNVGNPMGALMLLETGMHTTYFSLASAIRRAKKPLVEIRNEYADFLKSIEKDENKAEKLAEYENGFWIAEHELENYTPIPMRLIEEADKAAKEGKCKLEVSTIALERLIDLGIISED